MLDKIETIIHVGGVQMNTESNLSTLSNILETPSTPSTALHSFSAWQTTKTAKLASFSDHREVLTFALTLEPHEVQEFLQEYLSGKDLGPWLDAMEYDRMAGTDEDPQAYEYLLGK